MTINEAIFTVCTTKFKKDALDAHRIVKAYGLQVFKNNGEFVVYNPVTRKRVTVSQHRTYEYNRGYVTLYTVYGDYYSRVRAKRIRFDFLGYLRKPVNTVYRDVCNAVSKPTIAKYNRIKSARLYLGWRQDEVTNIQAQIEKLQKDLIYAVRRQVEYENELAKIRAELGLKRR